MPKEEKDKDATLLVAFKIVDKTKPVKPERPLYPYTEADDRKKFWLIWCPYQQYVSPEVYDNYPAARDAALVAAAKNPGTDWYVMESVKFAYKAAGNPVEKTPI